jgi:hypothetical protein
MKTVSWGGEQPKADQKKENSVQPFALEIFSQATGYSP